MSAGVYALVDPVLDFVGYVGQSVDLVRRERQYRRLKNTSNWVLLEWLKATGCTFEFRVLDVLEPSQFGPRTDAIEASWIRHFKDRGQAVFNVKDFGCFGTSGRWSEEDRRAAFAVAGILDCFTPRKKG